jgi:hypothetical protein
MKDISEVSLLDGGEETKTRQRRAVAPWPIAYCNILIQSCTNTGTVQYSTVRLHSTVYILLYCKVPEMKLIPPNDLFRPQ